MGYNALILGQSSPDCTRSRCAALASFVETTRLFSHIHEQSSFSSSSVPFSPDVLFLRASGEHDTPELLTSCKQKWNCASTLALFCRKWRRSTKEDLSLLNGVDDFLACPFQEWEFCIRVARVLQNKACKTASPFNREVKNSPNDVPLVGESALFLHIIDTIRSLASVDQTVLISGETGTGKEVVARAIHYQSTRRGKPFIPVNCGALPDHLFENELFGHVKGAFTDAFSAEKGLIAEAESGTLFLDEIDSLSMAAQVKLLRFLENGEYRPLGYSRSNIADVRVIAATNADLVERMKAGTFRQDLYYRINILSVSIPPLRKRTEDIIHLSNHFLAQYAKEHKSEQRSISREALHKLLAYEWPGNVRELEGVILRTLVLTASTALQPEDIDLPQQAFKASQENTRLSQAKISVIQNFELNYLTNLLSAHHGNVTHAARAAGKQRSTLQRLVRKYSLNPKSFRS